MMYLDFTLIVLAVGAVFAALAWFADRRLDAPVDQPARPDRHLPADEYRLLGEDWRDQVTDYMGESFIRQTRNRFAIYSVTGADPNSESRDLAGSGSLATKEETLARTGH